MPVKAPRICGCGKAIPNGAMCQCERVRKKASDKLYDAKRPNARQRGYDHNWEKEAKAFLTLPGNQHCVRCRANATVVDHIVSIRQAPHRRMDRTNWQPMCRPCNSRKNVRQEGGFGNKPRSDDGGGRS